MSSEDKRINPRVATKIRAEIHTENGMTFSSSIDLSAGGIFIATPEPIDPGTEVKINIALTPIDQISVKGIVKWIKEEDNNSRAGMGVEFVDISDVALNVIKNLVESFD